MQSSMYFSIRMEEINRFSTAQGRGRLHAVIWRASSYRRSTEQGRRRLHAPSWRAARPSALDEAGELGLAALQER